MFYYLSLKSIIFIDIIYNVLVFDEWFKDLVVDKVKLNICKLYSFIEYDIY